MKMFQSTAAKISRGTFLLLVLIFFFLCQGSFALQKKPNILVIMGDDIGWFNTSCYNRGMMGYRTPNIDRIANEGAIFMTWYAQQSCTAGRAVFVTGQNRLFVPVLPKLVCLALT